MTIHPVLLMSRELGVGGSERQLAEIARSLDRDSFEPHVACFRPGGFREQELRQAGVPVVRFPLTSFHSLSVLRAGAEMRRYVRRHGIEVVHTFDVPANLFGVPAARASGVPYVLSSQRAHRDLTPGVRRRLLRITDRLSDGVVVNCESIKRQLIAEDRVPSGRIHLCRNGVDTMEFHARSRARMPALEGSRLVVGVVCGLRPEKDLRTLIDAFAVIRDVRPGLRLAIVGSGPCESELKARCRELHLEGACHFEPASSRPAAWLRSIDIFVLPSRSEALSNSLMEAMACGCCPAASNTGGNPELVEEGVTGMLFPPGDIAALARVLRKLIEDDSLRLLLAGGARARVAGQFPLETAARAMERIYHQVLSEAPHAERAAVAGGMRWRT